ncbi:MAG: hypothetical protein IT486_06850 [Gammaproteobacteria bacterium]|nr:hypothetical protein [Gammaproteobacteria bacterium]
MKLLAPLLVAAAVAGSAVADDLTGADRLLCSTLRATACTAAGNCESLPPGELNIPQFVQVSVKGKELSTTPASGEDRRTLVQTVSRGDGQIVLQGYESGRAFSLVIDEASGQAAFASAAESRGVVVFAACTPMR